MQVDEVCKVRNAAVGRAGMGYSLAIFKGMCHSFYYARVALIDASFVPDKKLVTVELDTLKKVKQAQREVLQRKVTEACASVEEALPPAAAPPPLFGGVTEEYNDVMFTSSCTTNDDGLGSGNSKKKLKASGKGYEFGCTIVIFLADACDCDLPYLICHMLLGKDVLALSVLSSNDAPVTLDCYCD